jgi:hypothetical protein
MAGSFLVFEDKNIAEIWGLIKGGVEFASNPTQSAQKTLRINVGYNLANRKSDQI